MPEPISASSGETASGLRGRILVIDDEAEIRESLQTLLELEGYAVHLAEGGTEGLRRLEQTLYDLILLDLMLPDRSGLDVLDEIRARDKETPVFLITAYGSVDVAVEALKAGANDYFSKPWDNEKLLIEIERQIARSHLERENKELRRALKQRYSYTNIVGKSDKMQRVVDLVAQVAPTRTTILISGETGSGKEIIAKALHAGSSRADQSFVLVNAATLPPELLESALWGNLQSGSSGHRKGAFETANRGTLFLDEISFLSPDMQTRLMRVIEEREYLPLGSSDPVRIDVRLLAATTSDLGKLVEEGKFRQDLYYRLNVVNLTLPPLRDRKEDIPLLIEHFFDLYCRENGKFLDANSRSVLRFEPDALHILMDYNWPGNVRELENAIERAAVLATAAVVPVSVLPEHILHSTGVRLPSGSGEAEPLPPDASLFEIVADFERHRIIEILETCNYSQTEAAALLRVPLSTLNQKIKRLDIPLKRKSDKPSPP